MIVINEKVLDSNSYDYITVFDNIDVHGKKEDGIKTSYDISRILNYKNDSKKIEEVVRYFIRNHKIVEIADAFDEFIINSSSNVEIRISKEHKLSDKLLDEIYLKYYSDVFDTYSENVDFYWLTVEGNKNQFYRVTKPIYYPIDKDEFRCELLDKKCMIINMNFDGENLNYYDNLMLNMILNDIDDIYYDGETLDFYKIYRCTKNGKKINLVIDKQLWEFIFKIETKKERKKLTKRLQYRMEEFK